MLRLIVHLTTLLESEHVLRRLSGLRDADHFEASRSLARRLALDVARQPILQGLIAVMVVRKDAIYVELKADALGVPIEDNWKWSIPLPARKPFREAKLRLDAESEGQQPDHPLLKLLGDAFEVRSLVLGNPTLNINQLACGEGRCRKQLSNWSEQEKLLGLTR